MRSRTWRWTGVSSSSIRARTRSMRFAPHRDAARARSTTVGSASMSAIMVSTSESPGLDHQRFFSNSVPKGAASVGIIPTDFLRLTIVSPGHTERQHPHGPNAAARWWPREAGSMPGAGTVALTRRRSVSGSARRDRREARPVDRGALRAGVQARVRMRLRRIGVGDSDLNAADPGGVAIEHALGAATEVADGEGGRAASRPCTRPLRRQRLANRGAGFGHAAERVGFRLDRDCGDAASRVELM